MKTRFDAFMKEYNEDALSPALRTAVFNYVVKNGGDEEFESVKKYYNTTENPLDKSAALRALGMVPSEKKITELLEWIISSDEVRSQDKVFPYRTLAHSGAKGREMAWQFLQKRWDQWFKLFEGGFLVQHLAKIPSGFVTADKAKEVEAFFEKVDAPAAKRSMKQCIESIKQNASWRVRELENIRKWVQSQNK